MTTFRFLFLSKIMKKFQNYQNLQYSIDTTTRFNSFLYKEFCSTTNINTTRPHLRYSLQL